MPKARRHSGPGPGAYDRNKTAEQRRAERQRKLTNAAARVLAERGLASASVQQIVDEAGVSRQAFYAEFKDLRDALTQLTDTARSALLSAVRHAARSAPDPVTRVRISVGVHLHATAQNPDLARVVTREILSLGPEGIARREANMREYAELLMEGAVEAYAQGLTKVRPSETTAYCIVGGIDALVGRVLESSQPQRVTELHEDIVGIVLRSFAYEVPAASGPAM